MDEVASRAAELSSWIEGNQDRIVRILDRLVRIESPTESIDGVSRAADAARAELEDVGLRMEIFAPADASTRALVAAAPGRDPRAPYQLLVGHLDTVWPVGSVARLGVRVRHGRFAAPGALDMKAGLAQAIVALGAVQAANHGLSFEPVVFFNTDEETGSEASRALLERLARHADRVFVLEPAASGGRLKTQRMGVGRFRVTVSARSGHTGTKQRRPANAIRELGRIIEDAYGFEGSRASGEALVNAGVVEGGSRANVIADHASALLEFRVSSRIRAEEIECELNELSRRANVAVSIVGSWHRPPMERTTANVRLWKAAAEAAELIGIPQLRQAAVGEASDGNIASPLAPTLDGLGAVGSGAHAEDEHVLVDELHRRASLLAVLLTSEVAARI